MGNTNKHIKQSDFKSHHPSLHKAKLFEDTNNNHSYIEAIFKCQSKEYEQWQEKLKAANPNPNGYLLIPSHYKYNSDTGLCGNTGSLTVHIPPSRINTHSTPTSSLTSSRTATKKLTIGISRNQSYGTLSSP